MESGPFPDLIFAADVFGCDFLVFINEENNYAPSIDQFLDLVFTMEDHRFFLQTMCFIDNNTIKKVLGSIPKRIGRLE